MTRRDETLCATTAAPRSRNCARCSRRMTRAEFWSGSKCRACRTDRPTHLVLLDDRKSREDVVVGRERTRADAEERVRRLNWKVLENNPGQRQSKLPLYYCLSPDSYYDNPGDE